MPLRSRVSKVTDSLMAAEKASFSGNEAMQDAHGLQTRLIAEGICISHHCLDDASSSA